MALSTKTYKGARDFYPEDKRLQKYIFGKWRETAERFGYEEYDAPILEPLEIYLAKTGDEIVNEQTYVFEDRGGRKVVIRPEMTPTVSRMVAGKRQELGYPLRWYSIPSLWRYERPQKGRLREHWQLNVDIFGVKDTSAELEIINLVDSAFKAFGASEKMYEIRLNHRGLIDYLLTTYLGLSAKQQRSMSKLVDKKEKMSQGDFIAKADSIFSADQKRAGLTEKLMKVLGAENINDLPADILNQAPAAELKDLLAKLKSAGIKNLRYDGSLMRGFDYYTGIVFEVFDKNPDNNRSMLGGGRYDGLVGLFGVDPVPTVGFGWGDVTLVNFLRGNHLLPDFLPETDLYIARAGDVDVNSLAAGLRHEGLNVAVDLSGRKIGDQLKTADKKGIRNVLVVGEDELKTGKLNLKDLQTGKESRLDAAGIVKALAKK